MEAACPWTSVAEMIREDTAPAATYFLSPYLWSSVLLDKHRLRAGFVQRVPLRKKISPQQICPGQEEQQPGSRIRNQPCRLLL